MPREKLRPRITAVARLRPKARLKKDILDRLPSDDMPKLPQGLNDLRVAPAGLVLDPHDGITDGFFKARVGDLPSVRLWPRNPGHPPSSAPIFETSRS